MRLLKRGPLLFLPIFLAGLFLFGCATPPRNLFTVSGPDWRTQQGQALWTPKRGVPQFGGDLVVAADNTGQCLVQFEKTPVSLVMVQTTPKEWVLDFPQFGGYLRGHRPAPARTVWLYLPDALAGKPLPKVFRFEQKPDGNWRIDDTKTGESLEGFLAP